MMRLIFIYNAKSGALNGFFDSVHKSISPTTYSCSLCQITHGNVGIRKDWKLFFDELNAQVEFFHKDELERLPFEINESQLPAVYAFDLNAFLIASNNELKEIDSEELMLRIQDIIRA